MARITFPFGSIVDDTGAVVTGATVTIASVKDPATDADIAAHGATVVVSSDGLRVCALYDPATKGEAFITLLVVKAGKVITGVNASPVVFASADPQGISTATADTTTLKTTTTDIKASTDKLTDPRMAKIDGSQQAGSPVTLPTIAPAGYGGGPASFGPYKLYVAMQPGRQGGELLNLFVGDSGAVEFELLDAGGAVNIEGATVTVTVRDFYSAGLITDAAEAEAVYAEGGRIRYTLAEDDTELVRTLRFTVKVAWSAGPEKTFGPLVATVENS